VDEAEWIAANAARLGRALARPQVRAELLALLGTDDAERRRHRRLAEARAELAGLELRWKVGEDEDAWEA
jgi:hypothetical protein